ncbi:hypothetical protein CPJ18_26245 [Agrobacterium rosae]|uniref:Pectate lyase superfamily protein n=1 Tax=Agrobacterium rosae TaxID=1972867 RepID=A0AAE5VLV3_9HYPH|nr:hypothetical protein [Agrobacterium rosae]POO48427.1 hypothetical protein CPJ18_26245 [Agrobacterium rosae]
MKNSTRVLLAALVLSYPVVVSAQSQGPTFNSLKLVSPSKPGNTIIKPDGLLTTSPVFDVMAYDFVSDGVADNSAKASTLLSAVGSNGGKIKFPCGTFKFSTALAYTIPSGKNITVEGEGCTKLLFGNTDGLVLTYTNNSSWSVVRNLEIATSAATGTNTALWLKSNVVNVPQNARSTVIEHVHVNGSDGLGVANYWGKGIFQDKVSFVNIDDLTFNGRATPAYGGDGVVAQGQTDPAFNVVTNIVNSNFAYCETGFKYGTYYQGLSFLGSNITGCRRGIYSPVGNVFNLQATIADSQFANGVSNIEFASEMSGAHISNNIFLLHPNTFGIKTAGLINSTISANGFSAALIAGQGSAISIGTSGNTAETVTVNGNTCLSIASCITIASGAKGIASGNAWWNVTAPFTNRSVNFFQTNNIQDGARQVTQAGPLSAVSFSDVVSVNSLLGSKTSPTIASGFCTSPSILVSNGTFSFRVGVGSSCAASSGTVSMPTSVNGWSCTATSVANVATSDPVIDLSASSLSSIVIRNYSRRTGALANFASSDSILVNCLAQ